MSSLVESSEQRFADTSPGLLALTAWSAGLLLYLFAVSLLPALLISGYTHDGEAAVFGAHFVAYLALGVLLWWPHRHAAVNLRLRDGFLVTTLFWLVLSFAGGLPFWFSLDISLADAVFEAASAVTTTGATVLSGLDQMPPSLLFYRQQLQWMGGIGVLVTAVAILPLLGVGGMQLYRAETPGPMKDDKLTPRIGSTARALWRVYAGLTALCALAFWAGMSPFDAIAHSLSAVSTGGFSTHDASIAYYDNVAIEFVASVFMLAGGVNFAVHYRAVLSANPVAYLRDIEVRTFLLIVVVATLFVGATLVVTGYAPNPWQALRLSFFTVASVLTSTGFGLDDFSQWPLFLPLLLILLSFVGGCGGSTAGGMKVLRWILLFRLARKELDRLLHRHAVVVLKHGGAIVPLRVQDAVWGFFSTYMVVFVAFLLLLMAGGMDKVSAFGAVATSLNNLGPGLGEVATSFASVPDSLLWPLSLAMIMGRLEVFTVLVLLHPAFWRG